VLREVAVSAKCTCENLWDGLHTLGCPVIVEAEAQGLAIRRARLAEAEATQRARDEALREEGRKAALGEVATHLELVGWACAAAAQPLPRGHEKVALAAMAVVLRGHALSVSDGVLLSRTPDGRVTAPGCEPMTLEAVGQAMRSAVSPPKEGT
jgi:hypothetical protein